LIYDNSCARMTVKDSIQIISTTPHSSYMQHTALRSCSQSPPQCSSQRLPWLEYHSQPRAGEEVVVVEVERAKLQCCCILDRLNASNVIATCLMLTRLTITLPPIPRPCTLCFGFFVAIAAQTRSDLYRIGDVYHSARHVKNSDGPMAHTRIMCHPCGSKSVLARES